MHPAGVPMQALLNRKPSVSTGIAIFNGQHTYDA
jgi:hypothetical protein